MKFEQAFCEEIFRKKYMLNSESTPEDVFQGVATEVSSVEKDKEKWGQIFCELMQDGYFSGGGRIMANARPYGKHKYYNNCFTIPFKDSLYEIYGSIRDEALIAKADGGCGSNMSNIRPRNAPLSVGGVASGPISWMKISNTSAKEIMDGGGRRAAIIKLLIDNHPDVISFATCKQGENTGLDQMNISVAITSKFMDAVEKDLDWDLVFKDKVYKTLKARELYEIITKNAFQHNEPGVFFIDRVEQDNNSHEFKLDCVNPCLKDDATVIKKDTGIIPLKELQIGDYIWSREGWTKVVAKFPTGNKEVFSYKVYGGKTFESTANHEVEYNKVKVQVQHASCIDRFLVGRDKTETLPTEIESNNSLGFHDVWDITVDNESHTFWCQGFSISNCGEITLPSDGGVCNLGAINLVKFVKNAFEDSAEFDFEHLKKVVQVAVRFLDNIVDVTLFPLDFIEKIQKDWRRLGLGVSGVGDVFVMMKMKYGEKESEELADKIAQTICYTAYETSSDLAKEKGPFLKYNYDEIINRGFVKKLPQYIKDKIKANGLRNIGLLTIAPTGTTSIAFFKNCSSGIEPIFSTKYSRTVRLDNEQTKQETVYDYAYLEFVKKFGEDAKLPDYFITTAELDPYKGVDIQAVFQNYIDHSISKTANLPMNYTYEQYKDLFMYAYKKGLKGFTSFNPGGCCSTDTEIITTLGVRTFGDILESEGINVYSEETRGWFDLVNGVKIFDGNKNPYEIKRAFVRGKSSDMINLKLENGEIISVSPEHKFKVSGKWVNAEHLMEGDELDVY